MRLLIVTQKMDRDDNVLGFFHRWVEELAHRFESVTVICRSEGRHSLPPNVRVIALKKGSRLAWAVDFYKNIWKERKAYDAVFVHMTPIHVVLGGLLWKALGKRIFLWYTHKSVDLKLRAAVSLADAIFTASAGSFRLSSPKIVVTGHGIDARGFADAPRGKKVGEEPLRIVSVGRITPIKNCDTLVEAARILRDKWNKRFTVAFIGAPTAPGDNAYSDKVHALVEKYGLSDIVSFEGGISAERMPAEYAKADISANLTPPGGVDKAVFESMAAGVPAFSSNTEFKGYFGRHEDLLIFKERDAEDLAARIMRAGDFAAIGNDLQKTALEQADISALISRLSARMIASKSV